MRSHAMLPIALLMIGAFASTSASEFRTQKPGMWEIRMQRTAGGKNVQGVRRVCMDAAEQARAKQLGEDFAQKNCSKNVTTQEGNKQTNDMVCKTESGSFREHSVTDFSSDNTYRTQTVVTFDLPQLSSTATIDGKWVGACKSG